MFKCTYMCMMAHSLRHQMAGLQRHVFLQPSHLCLVSYVCLTPICDTLHHICEANFSLQEGKNKMTGKINVSFVENLMFADKNVKRWEKSLTHIRCRMS